MALLAIFASLLFLYSVVSRRAERSVVTAPMVFTIAGMLALLVLPAPSADAGASKIFLRLAEIGLVLLLFTDASRTDLRVLKSIRNLPVRLLSVGMLLTILLGALAAKLVFPQLSIWEAGILAAILAPTDAGLGQVIVTSPRVPLRIRQALNVEAGLNDGLSVPFLLFFIALAATGAGVRDASLTRFIVEQLGLGALVGGGIGLAGGIFLGYARRAEWIAESFQRTAVVALPLLCLLASDLIGASMFIAAFVGGLAAQVGFKDIGAHSVEFAEEWGRLFNLLVFFLFGMLAARDWPQLNGTAAVYAIVSLTVVRMLPVAIALAGTRLHAASVIFMGWFGPRGLASIVLGLVYLEEELRLPGEPVIRAAVTLTVLLSVFLHGLSAAPGINWYARKVEALGAAAPENLAIKT